MSARVLVVDDILPNVKLLEAKLTSEYYNVITAMSGKEALEKVKSERPDLVLLDIMMPEMDGFEVCKIIKSDPETAHIPIVMVTALTDAQDRVRGLEAGADDFLSKPINDLALMARVSSLVRLKMSMDEWRMRENTASQLGVVNQATSVMDQSAEDARILIIEDKEFERRKIAETLDKDRHAITETQSGLEAMELSGKQELDTIIVSLNLEHEDGLRLCSHLKSNEKTRNVPILMVGDEADMQRVAHGLEIGAHDYILRPIDRNELLARVRTQVRRKRFQQSLRTTYEISLSAALTDSLTGLYNRRYLEVHMERMLQNNQDSNKSMAVLMLDIDDFKMINDTHGHGVGDEILKTFAKRLNKSVRSFDLVARTGGEEFLIILPDVTEHRAYIVAERLRRSIADQPFKVRADDEPLDVTTSIGGIILSETSPDSAEILERVDKCLYQAKDEGKNCIVFEDVGRLDPDLYKIKERKVIK